MDVTTLDQANVFFCCILYGTAVGIVFDVFRIVRKLSRPRRLTVSIQDIIYWIIVAVAFFGLLLYANNGELRWYEFFGVLIGATLYFLFISHFVTAVILKIIHILSKIIIRVIKIVTFPLRFIYKLLRKPTYFAVFKIRRAGRGIWGYLRNKFGSMKSSIKKIILISKKI